MLSVLAAATAGPYVHITIPPHNKTVDWKWPGDPATIRVSMNYVVLAGTGGPPNPGHTTSALFDGVTPGGAPPSSEHWTTDGRMGVRAYFNNSGIRFRVVVTNTLTVSRKHLRDGSETEYRRIVGRQHRRDCINVYIVPTLVADHRGRFPGISVKVPAPAAIVYEPHPRRLAHEIGHLLGLGHTDRGVMWSLHPPVLKLKEGRLRNGAFTPGQVKKMHRTLSRKKELLARQP